MKFLKNFFSFFGATKKRNTKRRNKLTRRTRNNKKTVAKGNTKRRYKMRGG
jgi:hypothetical protein